jgi:serine/threonine-protein kinase
MSEAILKKFGKYFLLDRVGEGGMAEIFRARLSSLDTSGRFIVIKRIMGEHSNNQEFVSMFKAEVQVTMRFSHPNIVQIFDAGEEHGQHYIAMEFIDGRNLRQMLSKSAQKQLAVPIPASCYIIEQAAAGLHYAHAFKDRITGEALNLVHRDVSPQNIIVSYDGNIKVIDFGIAKATTNGEATRAGVIKGKLSYLSPEQVLGETLDGRSDIFALGIVLWETLTGKRLFVAEGDNEFQVLKMIESCTTFVKPPSQFNPAIPKDLDAVVMQALARDPRKRFQTGEELARALRKVLATQYSDFGPSDLSQFIKKMFHDVIVEDRKNLQTVNARAEELIALGAKGNEQEKTMTNATGVVPSSASNKQEHTRMTQFIGDRFNKAELTNADKLDIAGASAQQAQPQRQMKVASVSAPRTNPNHTRASGTRNIATPKPVESQNDSGSGGALKMVVGLAVVGAVGFYGYQQMQSPRQPASTQTTVAQTAPQTADAPYASGKTAQFKMHVFPDGDMARTKAMINGQPYSLEKGFSDVPVGEPVSLVIERPGFVTFRKEFTVQESDLNENKETTLDVKLEPMVYGILSISSRPSIADVTIVNIDRQPAETSKPIVFKTPINQEKLQSGNYRITIKNEVLNVEKVMTVEIKDGKETVLTDVQLEMKK